MGISLGDPQKMVALEWNIMENPIQMDKAPRKEMFPYIICRQN